MPDRRYGINVAREVHGPTIFASDQEHNEGVQIPVIWWPIY